MSLAELENRKSKGRTTGRIYSFHRREYSLPGHTFARPGQLVGVRATSLTRYIIYNDWPGGKSLFHFLDLRVRSAVSAYRQNKFAVRSVDNRLFRNLNDRMVHN